jgi:hypothetical protein
MICVTHVIDVTIYSCFYNGVNCTWINVFHFFLFFNLYLSIKKTKGRHVFNDEITKELGND